MWWRERERESAFVSTNVCACVCVCVCVCAQYLVLFFSLGVLSGEGRSGWLVPGSWNASVDRASSAGADWLFLWPGLLIDPLRRLDHYLSHYHNQKRCPQT